MPSIFHIFAHTIPVEERSRAFGYLVALGSIGQTVAALVSIALGGDVYYIGMSQLMWHKQESGA